MSPGPGTWLVRPLQWNATINMSPHWSGGNGCEGWVTWAPGIEGCGRGRGTGVLQRGPLAQRGRSALISARNKREWKARKVRKVTVVLSPASAPAGLFCSWLWLCKSRDGKNACLERQTQAPQVPTAAVESTQFGAIKMSILSHSSPSLSQTTPNSGFGSPRPMPVSLTPSPPQIQPVV